MATSTAAGCTASPVLLVALALGALGALCREAAAQGEGQGEAQRRDMVVFVKEQCHQPSLDMPALRHLVEERAHNYNLNIKFVSRTDLCGEQPGELAALLAALSTDTTRAVVGSFEAAICGVLDLLATMHQTKMIVTWGCPQQELLPVDPGQAGLGGQGEQGVQRLLPPLAATVQGAVRIATYYRMRTAAIVSSGSGWWQLAAQALDLALQAADIEVRHRVILPVDLGTVDNAILDALRPLVADPVRVVVLCVPIRTALWTRVVTAADQLSLVALPATALLALHPTSAIPFMAHDPASVSASASAQQHDPTPPSAAGTAVPQKNSTSPSSPSTSSASSSTRRTQRSTTVSARTTTPASASVPASVSRTTAGSGKAAPTPTPTPMLPMFLPKATWRPETQSGLLVLTALDQDLRLEDAFLGSEGCPRPDRGCPQLKEHLELWHYVQRSWDLMARFNHNGSSRTASVRRGSAWESTLVLLDWVDDSLQGGAEGARWRPLLKLHVGGGRSGRNVSELTPLTPRAWPRWKNIVSAGTALHALDWACDSDDENGCDEPAAILSGGVQLAVLVAAIVFVLLVVGIVATLIRQQMLRKRMSKGPCKILLTPNDLVFPHVPNARGVDEGMEAMLCCWLQQLQEFGGPEVDKPDLLKGSVGSLKSLHPPAGQGKSPGSSGSLARNIIVDPKARYNGDLVQLKELPVSGAFELKTKAMDILLTLHGLRHENMNPLLGCLLDSARPALVMEWCSRGSLEDVLVQDEIKLDWSFRLSLLTDLVRGMKYLHSTPVRVHGRLTSRNCVIDARWVLKVTDYGLPSFYDAQGITPPVQTARDLLWTAPELLRDENLRRRGSQPGDVYSFSIVMQEVVLRGEPFCILQLKPEEIIEKLKRPPPLIRPSVSKGAAPPEAINIMRQCWAELPESRPDFNTVHDQFKTLNHGRKVNFVDTMFQLLEKYSNNLEELIRERTEQLDCEKKKTEQLLNRMLPSQVAERLKMGQPVEPEDYQEVTIYFSDIVGFTAISCHSTPGQVVDLLNDLYTCFDATINAYNVYKVETIGDAYMVVGGLPVRVADHADQVATMALDLLYQSGRFQIRHLPQTPLRLRIGLHTGPCCAGVVGLTMPRYCLFGDTVNTASRMESTGAAWRVHISEATKKKLDDAYSIEYRGMTELKGKGLMPTYWLLGKKGFDKELPVAPPIGESHGLDESLLLPPKVVPIQSPTTPTPSAHPLSDPASAATKRRSFESGSSGEAPNSLSTDMNAKTVLQTAISAADAESADKRASRMLVCASIDNERTPTRRGSLQLATESAKISLYTMSISKSGSKDSRDLNDLEADGVVQAPLHATPQPLSAASRSETAPCGQAPGPGPGPSGIPFVTSPGMATPFSTSEVAVDLLGVSFLNPPGTWRSSSTNLSGPQRSKKPTSYLEEEDLSSGFNHYRCLSPHDPPQSRVSALASLGRGFLKRQYSLDRGDDPAGASGGGGGSGGQTALGTAAGRVLHKQNSAGAAHDLQRIEEIPIGMRPRPRDLASVSSKSASAESLA